MSSNLKKPAFSRKPATAQSLAKNAENTKSQAVPSYNIALGDALHEEYALFLASTAANFLLVKSEKKLKGEIDRQLAALQKRVKENLSVLEETRLKVENVCVVQEQTQQLSFQNIICQALEEEPSLGKEKNFAELMNEIDRIQNQLPCRNTIIPHSNYHMTEIQNATSQLLESVDCVCTHYCAEQHSIRPSSDAMQEIVKIREELEMFKNRNDSAAPKASACILNETVSALSCDDISPKNCVDKLK